MATMRNKWKFALITLLIVVGLSAIHIAQGQASSGWLSFYREVWIDPLQQHFLIGTRLPRLVIGFIAGAALAVSGLILQTMTRNPLASASTLGIHSGAFFFVVLCTIFFPSLKSDFPLLITLFGGLIAALLVSFLVGKSLDPVRIALTGLIVTLLFGSLTSALQLLFENEVSGLFLWGSGTLLQMDWTGVQFAAPFVLVALSILLAVGHRFDLLLMSEEVATGLGENVKRTKILGWGLAILLASTTVTVVGPIGFVGILAPHIVRFLGFRTHRLMILMNILIGGSLLIGADILLRMISPRTELPVGAMTALIGAPLLVYLALKMSRSVGRANQVVGGTVRITRPAYFYSLFGLFFLGLITLSLSYGGTSFTPLLEMWNEPFIRDFRLPRVFTSLCIGMMMGMSGLLLQTVLRNPLADASVLGITAGANVMAVLFLLVFSSVGVWAVPIGALIGGLVTLIILLTLSAKKQFDPMLLVLMGIAFSAIGASLIQILLVRANVHASAALTWLAGSTYGMSQGQMILAAGICLVTVPIILHKAHTFEIMSFQDELSIGLGVKVVKVRLFMVIVAVIVSSLSVAIVGAIGFIGLLAPHIARQLIGPKFKELVPMTLIMGASLLLLADFVGRVILAPMEIPAGIIVSLIGAPYLLYLLKQSNKITIK